MKLIQIRTNYLISTILIICLLLASSATPSKSFVYFSPEGIVIAIAVIGSLGFVITSLPNLLPVPTSVSYGDTFVLISYFPYSNSLEFELPDKFALIEKTDQFMHKTYKYRAPIERGIYPYNKRLGELNLSSSISVLTTKEVQAGIINPTRRKIILNPFIGGSLQILGFPFGLGYAYADMSAGYVKDSVYSQWPMIKSMILAGISVVAVSIGNANGSKPSENPGVYFAIGALTYTIYDVVNQINVRNDYARNL